MDGDYPLDVWKSQQEAENDVAQLDSEFPEDVGQHKVVEYMPVKESN
jgi:hypothetical protein